VQYNDGRRRRTIAKRRKEKKRNTHIERERKKK
jgi:hypothetical protein